MKPLKDMTIEDLEKLSKDALIGIIIGVFFEKGVFTGTLKKRLK